MLDEAVFSGTSAPQVARHASDSAAYDTGEVTGAALWDGKSWQSLHSGEVTTFASWRLLKACDGDLIAAVNSYSRHEWTGLYRWDGTSWSVFGMSGAQY